MLPDGSSFWYPRLNLPVMLAQPVALCFIIDALPAASELLGQEALEEGVGRAARFGEGVG
jgi:hypothetical protein